MTLEIASFGSALGWWEAGGYIATAFVLAGVAGESLIQFTHWIPLLWRPLTGKASALVLVGGLACEIITQVMVNTISGQIISFLNNETAQARLELAQIKQPRTMRTDQRARLTACLKFTQKGLVYVRPALFDTDGPAFGQQIAEAFKDAGFDLPPWPAGASLTWSQAGIFLIVRDLKNPPPFSAAVQKCFFSVGIPMYGFEDKNHPAGAISIGIGPRL